jgi:dephospho-CoA kinase
MKRIGITGPTGAGKTTALHALEELGARLIDCDALYHRMLAESVPLRRALTERFGTGILDGAGAVDRKRLGDVVFGDPEALADLNGITHRLIMEEVERQCGQAQSEGCPAVAIDAIALIESGVAAGCDAVVGILAPRTVRIRRIMAREGISEVYATKRVDAQQPEEFYRRNCGYILENREEDTPQSFQRRALELFRQILGQN